MTSVKFIDGAWLVLLLIPTLVGVMLFIRREYDAQTTELDVRADLVFDKPHREQRVVIPVNGINRSVVQAVMFGRSLATDPSMIQAMFVTTEPRGGRGAPRTLGAAAAGRPAGHRRVALPGAGRAGRHLPRRPRPCLATGPADPHDDRRPARVRRPPLVGPGAVQPDGQAPQGRARRARAHGHRGRTLSTERSPARLTRRPITRSPSPTHDRRTAAHQGPEARGPARPRRTAARAVLPVHGTGPAAGKGRGVGAADGAASARSRRSRRG